MSAFWTCPDCGTTVRMPPGQTTPPFCQSCEWRHAVLIEMEVARAD